MAVVQMGRPLLIGIPDNLKKIHGLPSGKVRMKMRAGRFMRVYVRPKEGGIREFVVEDRKEKWIAQEVNRNLTNGNSIRLM